MHEYALVKKADNKPLMAFRDEDRDHTLFARMIKVPEFARLISLIGDFKIGRAHV